MNGLVGGAFIGFLSTPSARRATIAPPLRRRGVMISIHALREEGDRVAAAQFFFDFLFLSTPSARRATCCRRHRTGRRCISIHSHREEGDASQAVLPYLASYFYPRPPRGGRRRNARSTQPPPAISIHALREEGDQVRTAILDGMMQFLSTPSARRATAVVVVDVLRVFDFYPRPPRGGRLENSMWQVPFL